MFELTLWHMLQIFIAIFAIVNYFIEDFPVITMCLIQKWNKSYHWLRELHQLPKKSVLFVSSEMVWLGFIINSWVHLYFFNQFAFKFKHFIRSGHFDGVPNCYFEISWEKMRKNDIILIILIYLEHNKAMCYYLGHVNTYNRISLIANAISQWKRQSQSLSGKEL